MSLPFSTAPQIPPFPTGSAALLRGRISRGEPSASPGAGNAAGEQQRLKEVSQEFEALLLSFVLKAMRQTIPKSNVLGQGRDLNGYSDLLDLELAQSLSRGSGIGLSRYVMQDLHRLQAQKPSQPPPRSPTSAPSSPSADVEMAVPVAGKLTSAYGLRLDPFSREHTVHHGVDIAAPAGSEIRPARSGTVVFSGSKAGYGLTVILAHEDGYTTQYSHNSQNLVQVGEQVSAGQPIALVGRTGRATGAHVHFEVQKAGRSLDPATFLATHQPV